MVLREIWIIPFEKKNKKQKQKKLDLTTLRMTVTNEIDGIITH